jgi:gliding motility-associated-like protein
LKDPNDILDFDNLIKDSFEGAGMEPPPGVWESVSSQLSVGAGTAIGVAAKSAFIKTIAAKIITAALVTGVVGSGAYFIVDSRKDETNRQTKVTNTKEGSVSYQIESNNSSADEKISGNNAGNDYFQSSPESTKELAALNEIDVSKRSKQIGGDHSSNPSGSNLPTGSGKSTSQNVSPNTIEIVSDKKVSKNVLSILLFDSVFCPGQDIQAGSSASPYFNRLVWDNGNGTLIENKDRITISYPKKGVYTLKLFGFKDNASFVVKKNIFIKDIPSDFEWTQTEDHSLICMSRPTQGSVYFWSVGGKERKGSSESSIVIAASELSNREKITIKLSIKNSKGCESMISKVIPLIHSSPDYVSIPNIFTPLEQDDINDCFSIEIENPLQFNLVIRDKKGNVLFSSISEKDCWNGKVQNIGNMCERGEYYYQLQYHLQDKEPRQVSGIIYLN